MNNKNKVGTFQETASHLGSTTCEISHRERKRELGDEDRTYHEH